ncbi:ferredoxin reductase [Pseudonocardia sp. N23]|nr:ferredoxin reductase [Pseudonocardia sp. N23]
MLAAVVEQTADAFFSTLPTACGDLSRAAGRSPGARSVARGAFGRHRGGQAAASSTRTAPPVVVGAGQAGIQAADSLGAAGHTGPVVVLGDEAGLPHQRPPLSKDVVTDEGDPAPLPLVGERFFTEKRIGFRPGTTVRRIDRARHSVVLADGEELRYSALVLATGAAPRPLTVPGAGSADVLELRTLADARALRASLLRARSAVVVGAGFTGLELAAAARRPGVEVTVPEFADRVLGRAVSPETGPSRMPKTTSVVATIHRLRATVSTESLNRKPRTLIGIVPMITSQASR